MHNTNEKQTKLNTLLVKVLQTAYHNAREYGLPLKDETKRLSHVTESFAYGDFSSHFRDGVLTSIKGFNKEYDELFSLIETEVAGARESGYIKGFYDGWESMREHLHPLVARVDELIDVVNALSKKDKKKIKEPSQ